MQHTLDPSSDPAAVVSCSGCGHGLSGLPVEAAFCPGCGRALRVTPTVWRAVVDVAARLARRRREPERPIEWGSRAAVVVGYGNALWRLGWRYEHGRGMARNVPEAMRCYGKSAHLGNAEAQSRLHAAPVAVLPVPDDA